MRRRHRCPVQLPTSGVTVSPYGFFLATFVTVAACPTSVAVTGVAHPQNFPGGAAAFWSTFSFQFDDQELVHLRHGTRNAVIMDGASFGEAAALRALTAFAARKQDASIALAPKLSEVLVLGVSLIGGRLVARRSDEPFREF
jgi:hypothetical protein